MIIGPREPRLSHILKAYSQCIRLTCSLCRRKFRKAHASIIISRRTLPVLLGQIVSSLFTCYTEIHLHLSFPLSYPPNINYAFIESVGRRTLFSNPNCTK